MSQKLTILTTTTFTKAQIIITRLESAGIECYLRDVNLIQPSIGSGVKVLVNEDELDKAVHLLKELHLEFEAPSESKDEEVAFPDLFLVPVDFSPASLNACFYAIELAARLKARIKLVHTYGIPDIRPLSFDDTDFYSSVVVANLTEIREEAEKNIGELLSKLQNYAQNKALTDVPISSALINGIPEDIILYMADTENAGMIILGISPKDFRPFEPMGKVASRIISKAKPPVLVIPEDIEFKGMESLNNILYSTAFDESDFSAIHKLISLIKPFNMNIYCLHIGTGEEGPWDNIKMEGLHEYFNKVYTKANVECDMIISPDIIKALDQFIIDKKINILSVTTHKRNLISKLITPSLTQKILYHTRIPLLIFHA
jgi:Universal stress protein UspA and related nucleotide-binding proteins